MTSNEEQDNISGRGDCDTYTDQDDDDDDQFAMSRPTTDSIVVHRRTDEYPDMSDKVLIKWVVEEGLGLDFSQYVDDKEIRRFGIYDDRPTQPIRVKIKTVEKRREIMRRRKETNIEQRRVFSGIYIHNCLTRPQMQQVWADLNQKLEKFKYRYRNVIISRWNVVDDYTGSVLYTPEILVSEYY